MSPPALDTRSPEGNAASRTNIVPTHYAPTKIAFLGDSITKANPNTGHNGYTWAFRPLMGGAYSYVNCGAPGDITTDVITTQIPGRLTPAQPGVRYGVVMIGVNNITADWTAANIEADLTTIYNTLVAANVIPVPVCILPFGTYGAWSAPREAVRNAVNDWIMQQAYRWVRVWDVEDNATNPAQPRLKAAYDFDGIHPTPAAEPVIAQAIFNQGFLQGPAAA